MLKDKKRKSTHVTGEISVISTQKDFNAQRFGETLGIMKRQINRGRGGGSANFLATVITHYNHGSGKGRKRKESTPAGGRRGGKWGGRKTYENPEGVKNPVKTK